MKKWIAILLGVSLMLSCAGLALAEEDIWTFDTDNYSLDGYSGSDCDVVIPETLEDCPTEILGADLFNGNASITSVVVPENCNTIERSAFYWCENLTRVSLPQSLQVIGEYAFFNCTQLTEITIPAAVGYIGDCALNNCEKLRSITFEGEVPDFGGEDVFYWIAEDAVFYVPDDRIEAYRTALPEGANVQSSGKSAVTVSYLREEFEFDAATGTITAYKGFAPIVAIPSEIDGTKVTAIGDSAFSGHRYAYRVDIPEGVTYIGPFAFRSTWVLADVNLPSTLISIDEEAFSGFRGSKIVFPSGLEEIGRNAFSYSSLCSAALTGGVKTIGEGAFSHCAWLNNVSLSSTLESIGENAFADSNVSYIYMDGVELPDIADTAFAGCEKLADIDLNTACTKEQMLSVQANVDAQALSCRVWRNQNPDVNYPTGNEGDYEGDYMSGYTGDETHIRPYDSHYIGEELRPTTGIADGALKDNQVVKYFSVPYNDVFTYIGAEAFAGSAVETVDLFDSVTTIGASAFEGSALTSVKGGEAITSIGERAFANCNLSYFVIPANAQVAATAFEGVPIENLRLSADATDEQVAFWSETLNAPWYAPVLREGEASTFVTMPFEPTPEEFFEIDASTGYISAYTGPYVDVVVPRTVNGVTVTGIAYNAFEAARDYTDTEVTTNQTDWLRMRTLVLPETVTYIADSAFSYCQQLETFVCYGPLESTGRGVFMLCRSLDTVVFVNGARVIDNYAFSEAGKLSVFWNKIIPDTIGDRAFEFSGIETAIVTAKTVSDNAYWQCPNLSEAHIHSSVESLGAGVFTQCPNLTTLCLEIPLNEVYGLIAESGVQQVYVPEDFTDQEYKNTYIWLSGFYGPLTDESQMTRKSCDLALQTEMPSFEDEIRALMAEGRISEPSAPAATAKPVSKLVPPSGDAAKPFLGTWHLLSMSDGETVYSAADMGMKMSLTLDEDGTAEANAMGELTAMTWAMDGASAVVNDSGSEMRFALQDDGTIACEADGAMMIFGREAIDTPSFVPAEIKNSATLDDFMGVWTLSKVASGEMVLDASACGMDMTLSIQANTVQVKSEAMGESAEGTCFMEGNELVTDETVGWCLRCHTDGMLSSEDADAEMTLYFVYTGPCEGSVSDQSPVAAATEAPTPPAADVDANAYLGTWYLIMMEYDGMQMNPVSLGMRIEMTLNDDGSAVMSTEGEEPDTLGWTLDEGGLKLGEEGDWMTVQPQADGTLLLEEDGGAMVFGREAPEAAENDLASSKIVENPTDELLGVWTLDTVFSEGMALPAADFGMEVTLTIGPSAIEMDFMGEMESCEWQMDGSALVAADIVTLYLHENGMLSFEDDGTTMWFAYAGMYDEEPTSVADPKPEAEPEAAEPDAVEPEPSADYGDRMETRYVMTSAEVSGYTLTLEQLGGIEYSLLFHANGTADVVMAGTTLPSLPWSRDLTNGVDAFVVDYYGTPLTAVLTDTGFDMNYFDTMLIHFEVEE